MRNHTKPSNIILFVCMIAIVSGLTLRLQAIDFESQELSSVHNIANDTELISSHSATADFVASLSEEAEIKEEETSFIETNDRKELVSLMEKCQSTMSAAHDMAEAGRALGYEENHDVIKLAVSEYERAKEEYKYYKEKYEVVMEKWQVRAEQYPTATYVWLYFSDLGYSDTVIAGILGNMMVECGGHSLSLNYSIYSADGYYGLCQWSSGYQSNMWGKDLESQCEFLASNISREFDTYGHLYSGGFSYSSFMSLTNEKEAAVAFARVYERCKLFSLGTRRACATTAYDYFVE